MAATQAQDSIASPSTKPVKTFRLRGISASIFENHATSDGREITFHKVSVQRSFKNGEEWKQNSSFARDDLPVLRLVVQRAWEFILDREASRGKEEAAE